MAGAGTRAWPRSGNGQESAEARGLGGGGGHLGQDGAHGGLAGGLGAQLSGGRVGGGVEAGEVDKTLDAAVGRARLQQPHAARQIDTHSSEEGGASRLGRPLCGGWPLT